MQAHRESKYRIDIDLIIDECQNFISQDIETILTETRKYGLYLTLAQQFAGSGMTQELKKIVLGNCNVKIIGGNSEENRVQISKSLKVDPRGLPPLRPGRFLIKSGMKPIKQVIMPKKYIGTNTCIAQKDWLRFQDNQSSVYYREEKLRGGRLFEGIDTPENFQLEGQESDLDLKNTIQHQWLRESVPAYQFSTTPK